MGREVSAGLVLRREQRVDLEQRIAHAPMGAKVPQQRGGRLQRRGEDGGVAALRREGERGLAPCVALRGGGARRHHRAQMLGAAP